VWERSNPGPIDSSSELLVCSSVKSLRVISFGLLFVVVRRGVKLSFKTCSSERSSLLIVN
jgi:hypothetical protein